MPALAVGVGCIVVICAGPLLDAAPGPKIELRSAVIGSFALGCVVLVVLGNVTDGAGAVGSGPTLVVGGEPGNGLDGVGNDIGVVVTVTGCVLTL